MAAGILTGWAALCLAGCATLAPHLTPGLDPRLPASEETRLQARVLALAAPLLTANAHDCPDPRPFSGLVTTALGDWPASARDTARGELGVDHRASVWIIAPGSPAAQAGLRHGDVILALNAHWSAPTARWHDDFRARAFPAALAQGDTRLRVQRGAEHLDLVITPQSACAAGVSLVAADPASRSRQPVWIAAGTLHVSRAFARDTADEALRQTIALALARHIAETRPVPALLARAHQADAVMRFTLGLDAMDQLAGRGPEHSPPRWQTSSEAEAALAALMLERAGVYASPPSPFNPASPAASGPAGASDSGSISSGQP